MVLPRRWVQLYNPEMADLITEYIGDGWNTHMETELIRLEKFADDRFPEEMAKGEITIIKAGLLNSYRIPVPSCILNHCLIYRSNVYMNTKAST